MDVTLSNKASGAGNQQERLGMAYWISGFTDGEGCFTVSVIKNPTTRFGKQIFPEFVITQGGKSLKALRGIQKFFNCGSIVLNKRYDNHNEDLYRFCVRSVRDLQEEIIPFFMRFPLRTEKRKDFLIFKNVIA
ncbi:MAG: LAGLIDADG family homing endonuclease, partial [Candidatus Woesebacteria bacterium]|nr:LAGLIDADG family homing endonuclease [Candidatus Woesebacteria bacterium]